MENDENNEKENNKEKKNEKNDKENDNNKRYQKNKRRVYPQNIYNNLQDSKTFLEELKSVDNNFRKNDKIPNIDQNIHQRRNTEEDFTMNVNETLIENPYPNLDDNPLRRANANGNILNLAQNQEQINLLRIIADNLNNNNNQGISYSIILISYIICFLVLTYNFRNYDGFRYSASTSLYCMILAVSCLVCVLYLNEIRKIKK